MKGWPEELYGTLKAAGVRQVGYVPDAGHKRLIELCLADRQMRAVVLSTEEEGIGLAAGAWLGGQRSALLMFTSCGWFFSDLAGIETVQVLRYAARVIELMDNPPTQEFLALLSEAKSNQPDKGNGADLFLSILRPV